MLEALIFVVFPFCMLFAAISDMLSMTIANRVPGAACCRLRALSRR